MSKEKKKMQNVSFRHMDELLAFLPEDQLEITEQLRELVWECVPQIKERLSFNVPFYSLHKGICFIWPGAVSWGKKTKEGVDFGFNYGHLLHDPSGYLEQGNRKQVFMKNFRQLEDIDDGILRHFIFEAVEVDEMVYREKMRNKKKR